MEYATCHLYFLRIHTRLKARVYAENTSDAWHIPRYATRKHCITSIYYIILYYIILYYIIVYYCIVLYYIVLYYILYYVILYIVLYCIILYYTIFIHYIIITITITNSLQATQNFRHETVLSKVFKIFNLQVSIWNNLIL